MSSSSLSSGSSDELTTDLTMPESTDAVNFFKETSLPEKSANRYIATYDSFIEWKNNKQEDSFSEDVFLMYFKELAEKYKPSSLWAIYSQLKSTVNTRHSINIHIYTNLTAYLKRQNVGYVCTKTKILSREQIEKFINEAPDYEYLATKVASIFGITGACKRQELADITVQDIENHNEMILVKIPTKVPRSFTIRGKFYKIVKKYEALRKNNGISRRFFQHYRNGKCTTQVIGKNKFGSMPKEIARFLNLPDANDYTGHSFRKTSGAILKSDGGWKPSNVAEGYALQDLQDDVQQGQTNDGNQDLEITNNVMDHDYSTQLLMNDIVTHVKTENIDVDLDPASESQSFDSDDMRSLRGDAACDNDVKPEVRSTCRNETDSCPAHTQLLEAILSCVSRQEQSAARAALAQEAQAHALERIARILEDRQRL